VVSTASIESWMKRVVSSMIASSGPGGKDRFSASMVARSAAAVAEAFEPGRRQNGIAVARLVLSSAVTVSSRRPGAWMLIWTAWPVAPAGGRLSPPAARWRLARRSSFTTSPGISPRAAARAGSSQTRIASSRAPNTWTSPMPSSGASRPRAFSVASFEM
jgi:hypothetical protein